MFGKEGASGRGKKYHGLHRRERINTAGFDHNIYNILQGDEYYMAREKNKMSPPRHNFEFSVTLKPEYDKLHRGYLLFPRVGGITKFTPRTRTLFALASLVSKKLRGGGLISPIAPNSFFFFPHSFFFLLQQPLPSQLNLPSSIA